MYLFHFTDFVLSFNYNICLLIESLSINLMFLRMYFRLIIYILSFYLYFNTSLDIPFVVIYVQHMELRLYMKCARPIKK